jgi:putative transcriptional regulator
MAKAAQYRSSLIASIHETAEELNADWLMSKQTLCEFDELCLPPCSRLHQTKFAPCGCAKEPVKLSLPDTLT